jgi:undecaprenyl-diphosphatase
MTAAVTCALLTWLVLRSDAGTAVRGTVLALAVVSVAGVCLTRIVLGVHWLTDTVVGALLGTALAAVSIGLWNTAVNKGTWAVRRVPAEKTEREDA